MTIRSGVITTVEYQLMVGPLKECDDVPVGSEVVGRAVDVDMGRTYLVCKTPGNGLIAIWFNRLEGCFKSIAFQTRVGEE
jgi:hypothetical protein